MASALALAAHTIAVGHSDGNGAEDVAITVSYSLNCFYNLNSRVPTFRFGTGHIYNHGPPAPPPPPALPPAHDAPSRGQRSRTATKGSTRATARSCSSRATCSSAPRARCSRPTSGTPSRAGTTLAGGGATPRPPARSRLPRTRPPSSRPWACTRSSSPPPARRSRSERPGGRMGEACRHVRLVGPLWGLLGGPLAFVTMGSQMPRNTRCRPLRCLTTTDTC